MGWVLSGNIQTGTALNSIPVAIVVKLAKIIPQDKQVKKKVLGKTYSQ